MTTGKSPARWEKPPLTLRERDTVLLVAHGYKDKQIAEKLSVSVATVKRDLQNIFDKLGVSDRLELTFYAVHKNIR